jgi:hypothetical protein
MFKLRSTGPATTLVLIEAELLPVLVSLAFDTEADAETVFDPGGTGPLTVMAASAPPVGTGLEFVHRAVDSLQVQPLPEADVGEKGSGMLTVTFPELAAVPLLCTVIL